MGVYVKQILYIYNRTGDELSSPVLNRTFISAYILPFYLSSESCVVPSGSGIPSATVPSAVRSR